MKPYLLEIYIEYKYPTGFTNHDDDRLFIMAASHAAAEKMGRRIIDTILPDGATLTYSSLEAKEIK